MAQEITIERIEWQAPEYTHKERSTDWFWSIGLGALALCIGAVWFHNYVFAIFILISGASLIMFTLRHPQIMTFAIDKEGLIIDKEVHPWNKVKGFRIKDDGIYPKLLVLTAKQFMPMYTIPLVPNIVADVKDTLLKIIPETEIEESRSTLFMEKIGF